MTDRCTVSPDVIALIEHLDEPAAIVGPDRRLLHRNAAHERGSRDEADASRSREAERCVSISIANGCIVELYRRDSAELERRMDEMREAQARLLHQEKISSLGRMLAGIAHELNNPINFVYGNVDFLGQYLDGALSLVRLVDEFDGVPEKLRVALDERKREVEFDFMIEDAAKLIASIRSGAERTATIVRDLRNFSCADSRSMKRADIVAGIESTLNVIAPLIKNRIEIVRNYADDLPRVVGNAGHLHQVFMNLLTNAAQAIEGEGTIAVEIDTIDSDRRLRVRVRDDGHGIAPDDLKRITDPFFTTKNVGVGTGLGLWITDSVIQAHGGTMTCESRVGEGSTFTVILPVRNGEYEDDRPRGHE